MKKTSMLLAVILFTVGMVSAQHRETLALESFDYVKLDGNIRLYIEQASKEVVTVQTRKEHYLHDYRIEVRNNTLYIRNRDNGSAPKIKVYLVHPELRGIDADGLIYVNSENTITGERFSMKGDGLIRGTVEVDVKKLKVDLDGLCFMSFSGKADISDFKLDGLGRINAGDLLTSEVHKSADGLAGIKVMR